MTKKADEKVTGTGLSGGITFRDVAMEAIEAQTLKDDAKAAGDSMADHFLNAAQNFTQGVDLSNEESRNKVLERIMSQIAAEEQYMKSENCPIEHRWDKVPRSWTQCKSNVKKGIEAEFNPTEHKSMSKYRKALNDHRKAQKPEGQEGQAVQEAQEIAALNPELGSRVLALIGTVEGTTEEQQPEVLKVLEDTIEKIKVLRDLVPKQPTKKKETRKSAAAK